MKCILCGSNTNELLDKQFNQTYYSCHNCQLTFTDKSDLLSDEGELVQYSRHENSIDNHGYVQMFEDYLDYVLPTDFKGKGLDYGSGPEPVLSILLGRRGIDCDIYDPYYAKEEPFNMKYDLITSTEVFEHFYDPKLEIERIVEMLNPDGYLAVMTLFLNEEIDFQKWWYRRDPTHVTFYKVKTFEYLADKYNMKIQKINNKNIILLKKVQHTNEKI